MSVGTESQDGDPNQLIDAERDRRAWRAQLKRNAATRRLYRIAVGVAGGLVVLVGIVAIPAPGPGWAIVFVGLAILASEFLWAERLLGVVTVRVRRWTDWVAGQLMVVRALLAVATLALVLAIFWTYFAVAGVPTWLPGSAENFLRAVPGLP